jgi:pimeloyl-ACP methyl ester carboxylesterase
VRINLGDVSLWFDMSGPSVVLRDDKTVERPVLVAIHGGPGLDHSSLKAALAPLADDFSILFLDLRGHGRSDPSSAEFWNLRTWADDLRKLCDALGLHKPVVLGSSFGGDVALAYAGLFPDHPGGIILANTSGGHRDRQGMLDGFGRLGGDEAAAVIQRLLDGETSEASQADFSRLCYPLYSGAPGWAEESRRWMARTIRSTNVGSAYDYERAIESFDPWSLAGGIHCPVLILTGEDDPVCTLPLVEDLASRLPPETSRLVRLPGAHHTIFRDRPDLAFPAVRDFVSQIEEGRAEG